MNRPKPFTVTPRPDFSLLEKTWMLFAEITSGKVKCGGSFLKVLWLQGHFIKVSSARLSMEISARIYFQLVSDSVETIDHVAESRSNPMVYR